MKKPTIVVDTNVFIKALLHSPSCQTLYELFAKETFQLAISKEILEEISEVLERPKFKFPSEKTKRLIEIIKRLAIVVKPKTKSRISRDVEDNKFIEAAIEAKAKYIVSLDKDLLEITPEKLAPFNLKVIPPKEFIKILPKGE